MYICVCIYMFVCLFPSHPILASIPGLLPPPRVHTAHTIRCKTEGEGLDKFTRDVCRDLRYIGYAIHNLYGNINCVLHTRQDIVTAHITCEICPGLLPPFFPPPHLIICAMRVHGGGRSPGNKVIPSLLTRTAHAA